MIQPDMRQPVIIIGAGLAGLSCAKLLAEHGIDYLVIEASDGVGGRVRTDEVEGCRLDRGFQVFQTAYPEAQHLLNYDQLDLVELEPGALVRYSGRWCRMSDPLRRPQHLLSTLFNPIGNFRDRLKLLRMRFDITSKGGDVWLNRGHDESTLTLFREHYRFSNSFIEGFLRPWLSGIFLERDLDTSASYFAFVFSMLSAGPISYPRLGIQAIPDQLAATLAPERVRLNRAVKHVRQDSGGYIADLDTGEQIHTRAVVISTDVSTANRLTCGAVAQRPINETACVYYLAEKAPIDGPVLMLNGDAQGPINHVFVHTNAVPSLAPEGQALISVSLVGRESSSYDPLELTSSLRDWFGEDVDHWRQLRVYHIANALPEQRAGFYTERIAPMLPSGMFVCGDHVETTSVNGALKSGRTTAARVRDFLNQPN